jgi:hypothetical protein
MTLDLIQVPAAVLGMVQHQAPNKPAINAVKVLLNRFNFMAEPPEQGLV